MHQSVRTIDSPEFINLQPLDINPLMSKCEIKVMYLGENRNHSYITKEVATEMAKTLRGAPIVGYYKEDKQDFADHGEQVVFDDEGIHFNCLTKPYGFVAPDSEVWFQKFEDTDDFGNKVEREYLMTTGYLWTGQYEECKPVIEQGKPHSMELDSESIDGHWSTNSQTGMDYFIINDAIFSKLCILGDDVEPCFEGSSVTAPQVSTSFTKKVDDTFKKTLETMMQDLMFALKGGQSSMNKDELTTEVKDSKTIDSQESIIPNDDENFSKKEEKDKRDKEDIMDNAVCGGKKKKVKTKCEQSEGKDKDEDEEEKDDENNKEDKDNDNEEDDKDKKYALLQEQYTALETKYQALVEFKNQIDNEKKDALIAEFYMLSDEDKKDVIENKSKYSLDEIEAKLSVICVRKKVNFSEDTNKEEDASNSVLTYNLDLNTEETSVPAWISAVRKTRQNNEK